MRLELSSPERLCPIEQLELYFVELDLSAQQTVRQAQWEPQNHVATVELPAVLGNADRISKQHEELVLLVLVAALTESVVPEMALAVAHSECDFGGVEVVLLAAVPVGSDSTAAAMVVPVDSS